MLKIPVIRWGQPYDSLEVDAVVHFATGEPIAKVSQANGGIIQRDMRQAKKARDILKQIPCTELIARLRKAADLYEKGTLPMGDGQQSPDDFAHQQSASTGLAGAHVPGEHGEEFVRAQEHGQDSRLPDARARPATS